MHRGLEVGIHLRPGLEDDNFIAGALANLAAFRLQRERNEPLVWQVLRVDGSPGQHHYRLVIRHPDRILDVGIKSDLARALDRLSEETPEGLAHSLEQARHDGLTPVPLRTVHEDVDFWRDDFWNWLG
ncbi:MAG: DUF2004 domain-containing protein [Thermoplasmata archaeon]